jgi:hypothetical protein
MSTTATATVAGQTTKLACRIRSCGWAQYVEVTGAALTAAANRLGAGDWREAVIRSDDSPYKMTVVADGVATDGPLVRGGNGMVAWVEHRIAKIKFTPIQQSDSDHRISDGTESVWFAWPARTDEDEVCRQYENGYDHNDSNSDVHAVIYTIDGEPVMSWTF